MILIKCRNRVRNLEMSLNKSNLFTLVRMSEVKALSLCSIKRLIKSVYVVPNRNSMMDTSR